MGENKSFFWPHHLLRRGGGGVGGRRDGPKADQEIVIRSRVLSNNYLEGFSTQSQVLLASIVEGKEIYFLLTTGSPNAILTIYNCF